MANTQTAPKKAPKTEQEREQARAKKAEENRRRFLELAPKRTQNVLDALRRLSNCGNPQGYKYSEEEAAKIIGAIRGAVDEVEAAFSAKSKETSTFTL